MTIPNADDVYGSPKVPPRRQQEIQIVEVPVPYPALALADDGSIPAHNFQISGLGLVMYEEATESDWADVGHALFKLEGAMQMAIGDWLNCGARFGRSIEWIAERLNRDVKTLNNWSRVASKFPETLRRETMFFGHYSLLAAKPLELKQKAVDFQSEYNWTVAQLREYLIGQAKRKKNLAVHQNQVETRSAEFAKVFTKAKKLPVKERYELASYLRQLADELES